jgi:uncharacterized membrane protein
MEKEPPMRKIMIAAAMAAVLAAGCSSGPSVPACKAAIKKFVVAEEAHQRGDKASVKSACSGLSVAQEKRIAGQLVGEMLRKQFAREFGGTR